MIADADILDGIDLDDGIKQPVTKSVQSNIPEGIITEPVYFDLETIPDFERRDLFGFDPLPEMPELITPVDSIEDVLKGSVPKIKETLQNATYEWIDELAAAETAREKPRKGVHDAVMSVLSERESIGDAEGSQNKKMSVTPEFCRIVAFGFAIGDQEPQKIIATNNAEERDLLIDFWSLVSRLKAPLVGFNVLHFDLPVIFVRSIIAGVEPSRSFDLKPWGRDVYDLMKKRFPSGQSMRMKDLARIYQIDVPAEDVDGSQVLDLYLAKEFDKIREYVASDVVIARMLYAAWSPFFS